MKWSHFFYLMSAIYAAPHAGKVIGLMLCITLFIMGLIAQKDKE